MAKKAEGFPNQVHLVLPPKLVEEALRRPVTRELVPTAIGYFPRAEGHYVSREKGHREHIFLCCVQGEGWVETGGRKRILVAGDAVRLAPGCPHRYGSSAPAWTIYWAHFLGRSARDYAGLLSARPGEPEPIGELSAVMLEADVILRSLSRGYGRADLLFASTRLAAWFGLIHLRRRERRGGEAGAGAGLARVFDWLPANLARTITVAEMAREAGMSSSHFTALFRRRTGYSPLDYFLRLRVQRACELLASTPLQVNQVAGAVGFPDPLYFSRVFRRIMGRPPSVFAQQARG